MPKISGVGKYARTPEENARRRQSYADAKKLGLSVMEARAIRRQGTPSISRQLQWSKWSTPPKRGGSRFPPSLKQIAENYNREHGLLYGHHSGYRYLWFTYVKRNSVELSDRKVAGYNE